MHIKNKRGQSTVEYILLVTAVVAVMIVFATSNNSGGFRGQLNGVLSTAANGMNSEMDELNKSHEATTAVANGTPPYSVSVCGGIGQPVCN
jgi:uncharacterized protein (UPF0333 family)